MEVKTLPTGNKETFSVTWTTQVPLTVAFAVTPHKVQGRLFTSATIDLKRHKGAGHNQFYPLYVQLSSLCTFGGLHLLKPLDSPPQRPHRHCLPIIHKVPARGVRTPKTCTSATAPSTTSISLNDLARLSFDRSCTPFMTLLDVIHTTSSFEKLASRIHPNLPSKDKNLKYFEKRAIVTPFNETVWELRIAPRVAEFATVLHNSTLKSLVLYKEYRRKVL